MPTFPTGRTEATQAGFSLIELLVVLVIAGVLVGGIALSLHGQGAREVEQAARRAEALVRLACERALGSGVDLGFSVVSDGLRFGYLGETGWHPIEAGEGDALRARALGRGLLLSVSRDGVPLSLPEAPGPEPMFACFGSGELTPFELRIERPDAPHPWHLQGRLDGTLSLREQTDARR